MANILVFDIATNRAQQYLTSVDTPVPTPANMLINPDLTALAAVPIIWWIVDAGLVREMTQVEKDALAAEQLAAQLWAENDAINQARIADLETKSGTAVLNADKLMALL